MRPSIASGCEIQIALINSVISVTLDICTGDTIPRTLNNYLGTTEKKLTSLIFMLYNYNFMQIYI